MQPTERTTRRTLPILVLIGLPLLLCACYPSSGKDTVADYDVVATFFDRRVPFASIQTYAMPDEIRCLGDAESCEPGPNDQLILSEIARNMERIGYVRELDPEENGADVFLLVTAFNTNVTVLECRYPWWPWWGIYPPGWGYWYPYCSPRLFHFTAGTLLIDMLDPEDADTEAGLVPALWTGIINGVLADGPVALQNRIIARIHQAFAQSPYLRER